MITKFNLKIKIMLLATAPLFAIFFFLANELNKTYFLLDDNDKLQNQILISEKFSALIHEMQKERGMSIGFLSSNKERFANELKAQRLKSDKKYNQLLLFIEKMKNVNVNYIYLIHQGIENLKLITKIRSNVDNGLKSENLINEILNYYSNTIQDLLDNSLNANKLINNANIARKSLSYTYFLYAKEKTGIERAFVNDIFITNKALSNNAYTKFLTLVSQQEIYINLFKSLGSLTNIDIYNEISQNQIFEEVQNMRSTIYAKHNLGEYNVNVITWFDTITKKIDLLKDIENELVNELKEEINQIILKLKSYFIILIIIEVLCVSFLIILCIFLAKSIKKR
ncbi:MULTISPECIES: nitrate- and nitrite sensing domain-containing protein [unclassified Campylobacter]|nr:MULTISPECIES: nitrate- and nitrite sensing domain-containing protein [unclassified Campylobacter]